MQELHIFLKAIALVFVVEGMLPFLSPDRWRTLMHAMASYDNRTLRIIGFASMLIGMFMIVLVHTYD